MKRWIAGMLCAVILIGMWATPAKALEVSSDVPKDSTLVRTATYMSGNGISVNEGVYSIFSSPMVVTGNKKSEYKSSGTTIATVTVTASFRYTGSSVSVVAKSYSKTVYNGWKFSKSSFSASGGKVTLKGSLNKSGQGSVPVSISIACDKNGRIS